MGLANAANRETLEASRAVGLVNLPSRVRGSVPTAVCGSVGCLEARGDHFFDSNLVEDHAHI
jgi:hypothetical protein